MNTCFRFLVPLNYDTSLCPNVNCHRVLLNIQTKRPTDRDGNSATECSHQSIFVIFSLDRSLAYTSRTSGKELTSYTLAHIWRIHLQMQRHQRSIYQLRNDQITKLFILYIFVHRIEDISSKKKIPVRAHNTLSKFRVKREIPQKKLLFYYKITI